ncbi:hypothetical protein HMN09_00321500 [Mycena chlorophos]|uniref:Uncharacterized protein n=1 Tax=Mycena chlorophos TaxID=658473 RepID=A0A8H6TIE4_MYCCL|nr:hypothetical protein HMN09_00321500 [Mycena chlorophos]
MLGIAFTTLTRVFFGACFATQLAASVYFAAVLHHHTQLLTLPAATNSLGHSQHTPHPITTYSPVTSHLARPALIPAPAVDPWADDVITLPDNTTTVDDDVLDEIRATADTNGSRTVLSSNISDVRIAEHALQEFGDRVERAVDGEMAEEGSMAEIGDALVAS